MQQVWLALIGGLILGWLIEWIVDWQFWRRNLNELREENQALRRQLAEAQSQLATAQAAPVAQQAPAATSGAALVAPGATSPTPEELPDASRDSDIARDEANPLGVTAAPADPQAEGE